MFHNFHSLNNLTTSNAKPTPPSIVLSKSNLIQWLRNILSQNDVPNNIKIQDLGSGVIFCKLINHYYSNIIPPNRIINHPKNQYENTNNLKLLQNTFVQLKITIPIDVGKISKMKFLQNWNLLNTLYKHFNNHNQLQISTGVNDDCRSISGSINVPTFGSMGSFNLIGTTSVSKIPPKRSFQNSVSNQYKRAVKDRDYALYGGKQSLTKHLSMPFINQCKDINLKSNNCQTPQNILSNQSFNHGFQLGNHHVYDQYAHITPKQSTTKIYNENQFENVYLNGSTSPFIQSLNPNLYNSNKNNISSFPYQNNCSDYQAQQSKKSYSPIKGKWSVNSNFFYSNHHAIIDRVKQILLKSSNDTEKIRQTKMLLGLSIDQDLIKIQDEAQNYNPVSKKTILENQNKKQQQQIQELKSYSNKILKENSKQNEKQQI